MEDKMNQKLIESKKMVYEAGNLIRNMMAEHVEVSEKTSKSDLVTNVDKATEQFLVEKIQGLFPGQSFLTEEDTVEQILGDDLWIIDPIDGTTNFIFLKENFSISLAFYHKKKPVFGIVYDVMRDKMYVGEQGVGAFLNDVPLSNLDQTILLGDSVLSGDVYHPNLFKETSKNLKPLFVTHRFLGSAALETAMIAASNFNAYVFPNITVWDIAAAVIILEAVGGTFIFGDKINEVYFDNNKRLFMASTNSIILNELISLL